LLEEQLPSLRAGDKRLGGKVRTACAKAERSIKRLAGELLQNLLIAADKYKTNESKRTRLASVVEETNSLWTRIRCEYPEMPFDACWDFVAAQELVEAENVTDLYKERLAGLLEQVGQLDPSQHDEKYRSAYTKMSRMYSRAESKALRAAYDADAQYLRLEPGVQERAVALLTAWGLANAPISSFCSASRACGGESREQTVLSTSGGMSVQDSPAKEQTALPLEPTIREWSGESP